MGRKKIGLLAAPVNLFELGAELLAMKRSIVTPFVEAALANGRNVNSAEKKATTLFFKIIEQTKGYAPKTTGTYLSVYERFANSYHRKQLEGLFGPSELLAMASYNDDDLHDIVSAKVANPGMTRVELKEMLLKAPSNS